MLQYYTILKSNTLFHNFSSDELEPLLEYLGAHIKTYKKNEVIRQADATVKEIGLVAEGMVCLSKMDYNGNRMILHELTQGRTFGESLAFASAKNSPITVTAAQKSVIIFMSAEKILTCCTAENSLHSHLALNLIKLLSEKNMLLQIKNDILSQKTTREKLLMYFEYESKNVNSKTISITYSREELADFLSLNTSALSRELCKMRDEGILTFKKNRFVLYDKN